MESKLSSGHGALKDGTIDLKHRLSTFGYGDEGSPKINNTKSALKRSSFDKSENNHL